VECWNTGYEKRKKIYSIKNVVSTFYDDAHQASIFCFHPRKYANITRKSIQLYSFWYSKSTTPIFQNPWFHHSIVPSFQLRSEAELSSIGFRCRVSGVGCQGKEMIDTDTRQLKPDTSICTPCSGEVLLAFPKTISESLSTEQYVCRRFWIYIKSNNFRLLKG